MAELLDLRYFVETALSANVTHAAERLFVTQPTLSRRIKHLEDELGAALFVRGPQSMTLTDTGKWFLPQAQELLEKWDALFASVGDASSLDDSISGNIRITTQAFIKSTFMMQAVRSFRLSHPRVNTITSTESLGNIPKVLSRNRVDVAFIIANRYFSLEGVSFCKLFDEELYLLVPTDSDLATRESASIKDLEGRDVVMFDRTIAPAYYDSITTQCINNGFMLKIISNQSDAADMALAAADNHCCSFCYSHFEPAEQLTNLGLCQLPIKDLAHDNEYGIAWRTDNNKAAVHAFVEETKHLANTTVDNDKTIW